jgi:AcrR family transcriptional regulator
MTARARAAERTGDRIVDAMLERFAAAPYDQIRLEDVAADARVAVQTVLRRFGSKSGLMGAVFQRELGTVSAARAAADTSDPERLIAELVVHYERYGALILKAYSEAPFIDGLTGLAAAGRAYHLDWCRNAFAGHLKPGLDQTTRTRRLAQLTAICDATTWRILREDLQLSPAQTRTALTEMTAPLLS